MQCPARQPRWQSVRSTAARSRPACASLVERLRVENGRLRADRLLQEELQYHRELPKLRGWPGRKRRRPGHNLVCRLRKRKESEVRFVHDLQVPFTNNQADRDLRMMKLKMKISGGFRSQEGAKDFATLRSVLSTGQKQGLSRIAVLMQGPDSLLAQLEP